MCSTTASVIIDLSKAANALRNGQLVAFPTETVYGLGADATSSAAVARIFEAKQRPSFDPLIVHIASQQQLPQVVQIFPDVARRLADHFWPGPLTMVLPRSASIPDLVTSGLPGVGVRIPAHPIARKLLELTDRPIAAPSANPFGRISPTTTAHVLQGLGDRIDFVVEGGPCGVGLESTVISLMQEQPLLLRHGGIPLESIEQIVGTIAVAVPNSSADDAAQPAPGMLSRHYAPRKPLILLPHEARAIPVSGQKCGLLTESTRTWDDGFSQILLLHSDTNPDIGVRLQTCAANFFAMMRALDSADLDVIIAHEFPEVGLGRALNDRLRRAAAGSRHAS
ncbi:MAG: threonylcarbamoyl-AMP synthase [Planctomycetaceae bacterium]|nr:threonylcarbamoyl-AMP synthase [Planctomycetaceae bacterium]